MAPEPQRRFLIIGTGIAGSLLAWELLRLGADVTLTRDPARRGSSRAAAGLITPITGFRFVKSWNLEKVYRPALEFYAGLAGLSGRTFFQPLPILRLFKDGSEAAKWKKKSGLREMQEFVLREWEDLPAKDGLLHRGGGIEITGGGWVAMGAVLETLSSLMKPKTSFLEAPFHPDDLTVPGKKPRWRGEEFDQIIFCQGYQPENPWFNWLPWKAAQGEILTAEIPDLSESHIINRGIFILPLGQNLFRIGATYNWTHLREEPAPAVRTQLENELRNLISFPYRVVDHHAAVRPILQDSCPVLGRHPQHSTLGIFNGLGSKGALTAPYYARQLARHLLLGENLDPEVDIARNF